MPPKNKGSARQQKKALKKAHDLFESSSSQTRRVARGVLRGEAVASEGVEECTYEGRTLNMGVEFILLRQVPLEQAPLDVSDGIDLHNLLKLQARESNELKQYEFRKAQEDIDWLINSRCMWATVDIDEAARAAELKIESEFEELEHHLRMLRLRRIGVDGDAIEVINHLRKNRKNEHQA